MKRIVLLVASLICFVVATVLAFRIYHQPTATVDLLRIVLAWMAWGSGLFVASHLVGDR